MDLKTTYMGLELKNPIIVGSCGLSKKLDGIRKINDSGAGCVILKSLFEEQIIAESQQVEQYLDTGSHAESLDYIRNYSKQHSVSEYLNLIEEAKKISSIPLIASLNCVSSNEWMDYAKKLENSGADGLELNIAFVKYNPKMSSDEIESLYFEIVDKILEKVSRYCSTCWDSAIICSSNKDLSITHPAPESLIFRIPSNFFDSPQLPTIIGFFSSNPIYVVFKSILPPGF